MTPNGNLERYIMNRMNVKNLLAAFALLAAMMPPVTKASAQPAAVEPKVDGQTTTPAAPEITLIEPGAEPRQELRITPRIGLVQTLVMRMQLTMSMKMGAQEFPTPAMPAMLVTMEMKVGEVSPEGDISYGLRVTDATVDAGPDGEGIQAELAEALEPVKKLTGGGVVSSRGITKSVKLAFPADMPSATAQAMSGLTDQIGQIGSPFPAEAVGIGAKWRVKSKLKSQGMSIDQSSTYTLKDFRDGTAFMEMTMEQTAAPQPVAAPGLPEGVTLELKSLASTGTGSTEFPLSWIVARKGTSKASTELALKITQGEQASDMTQIVKVEVTITGEEAKAEAPAASEPGDETKKEPVKDPVK